MLLMSIKMPLRVSQVFYAAQFFSCLINTFCRVKLRVVRSGVKPYSLIINTCQVTIRSYLGNLLINVNLLLHGNSFPPGCGFAVVKQLNPKIAFLLYRVLFFVSCKTSKIFV